MTHDPPSADADDLPRLMEEAGGLYRAGRLDAAAQRCRQILRHDPRHVEAQHLLGVVCLGQGQQQEALQYLERAAAQQPGHAEVQYNLGVALLALARPREAEAAFRQTIALMPEHVGALNNLGNALRQQQRDEEAIACYRRVLEITPAHAPALYNLGRSLAALDRPEEAVAYFRAALSSAGSAAGGDRLADIYNELYGALVETGRYDQALAACRAAAAVAGHDRRAGWNESLLLLLRGDYSEGWRQYENRYAVPGHEPPHSRLSLPDRGAVAGKRVLVCGEQGFGDVIQFARYVPLLADLGAEVWFQVEPALAPLLRELAGCAGVVAIGEPEPRQDLTVSVMSLPLVFGTTLETIPAAVPYLRAPADRLAKWRERLGRRRKPRIGIAWWGSQHLPKRSLPITALAPVLQQPEFEFHALQTEMPPEHRDRLRAHANIALHDDALGDFADTAALVSLMDLVVTIDTAAAHVAGALARPVWIMLRANPDWRWLLKREDSPWYPTARLFRQQRRDQWEPVVAAVAQALGDWPRG